MAGDPSKGSVCCRARLELAADLVEKATIEDSELVSEARKGSQRAYAEIVERYQRPLFSLVVRMVKAPELAEDLCQEAFVKAFKALDSYDDGRKFSSWLFKIAHNTTIDHLRRKRLQFESLDGDEESDRPSHAQTVADEKALSPEMSAQSSDLGRVLELAIDQLREDYREVIVLRFVEGLAYQEIADITGLPLGTVKTNIHRARKDLAALIEKEGYGR